MQRLGVLLAIASLSLPLLAHSYDAAHTNEICIALPSQPFAYTEDQPELVGVSFHLALKNSDDDRDIGDIITTQHLSECQTQDILSALSKIAIKALNDRIEALKSQVDDLMVENEELRITIVEYELENERLLHTIAEYEYVIADCFAQLAECEARCAVACHDHTCPDGHACAQPQ